MGQVSGLGFRDSRFGQNLEESKDKSNDAFLCCIRGV